MRKGDAIRAWFSAMVVVFVVALILPAAAARPPGERFVPGEVVVKLRSSAMGPPIGETETQDNWTGLEELRLLGSRYGVREVRPLLKDFERQQARLERLRAHRKSLSTRRNERLVQRGRCGRATDGGRELGRIYTVRVDAGQDLQEVLEAYRRHPEVEYAELNHIVSICAEPVDPLYASQWALEKIGAAEAWDTCRGSTEIIIAVVDTGVDYHHRDLEGNLWFNETERDGVTGFDDDENGYVDDIRGYNFIYNNADPMDDHGHGTHCAGTIAAVTDNGLDVSGICWRSRVMPVKVLGADGDGSTADAAVAIYYAVANGADVISSSWGGEEESELLKDAVEFAHRAGVVVVAAAGNESSDVPYYPAAYPEVIGVAATDSSDKRWYLSNYGDWVDIAAPGRNILSLRAAGTSQGTAQDAFTAKMSGTSMATPHASGACALLLSANPFLTHDEVGQILRSTGDPIAPGICASDARVNVAKAMRSAVPAQAMVRFDRKTYGQNDEIGILLADWHRREGVTETVVVETDGGDVEAVTLTETAAALGVFRAALQSERDAPRAGDGLVQVEHDERIVARYLDVDDGFGGTQQWSQAYAKADYEAASIVQIAIEARRPVAEVTFVSSEPTYAEIRYGRTPGGPYPHNVKALEVGDHHILKLGRLTPEARYYFVISLVDEAGNESIADDQGLDYTFVVGGDFEGFRVPGVYPTLQAAIDDASDGDVIWVADGTYSGEGNTEIDYLGKAIALRSEHGPESCVIDCEGEGPAFYFHSGETRDAILEGFTITNGGDVDVGGGIQCAGSSPTIRNCIFLHNSADEYGGGLYNCYGSAPAVVNCVFRGNSCSKFGWLSRGGGMGNRYDSSPTVEDCTFVGNSARYSGGGMSNIDRSSPRVIRCRFEGNSTRYYGGAVGNWNESRPTFNECVFSANQAGEDGGAMCNQIDSAVTLRNCVFSDNLADGSGGAMRNHSSTVTLTNCTVSANRAGRTGGGIWSGGDSGVYLDNCILWGNSDDGAKRIELAQIMEASGDTAIGHSCVEGWTGAFGGIGNFAFEPLFVDPNHEDFHLQSQGWRWDGTRERWTYDTATSPCIDAGNPGWPLGDELMAVPDDSNNALAVNKRINMGAYGGTAEASMAPHGWALLADVDNDALVDWADLVCIAKDWLGPEGKHAGDLTRDGAVNLADLAPMAREWRYEARSGDGTKQRAHQAGDH